ncbi:exonuclease SbcCD subunit D [Bacillus sp. RAR_GA_16]|uniref:metallophosphoesterase family protein n=1 Tax=Bacillus sp. RAR_GA_16 TaxID=2876774 RepID=UPI001CCE6A08|nr:exonuclease SbcCD subunit D C-terminal domain-containing protein [Bacillus sp. RAR_GA_16]MCA0172370.1 exonuclease SbcCD subunit D C-terminal domain-containing protein [Bacillus sp. RAR_GA_16]
MKLLHTADWHLGKTLEGRSRLPEQREFLEELQTIAEEENVDAILMAGDVFDTVNPPAAAETLFYDAAVKLTSRGERPLIIISGNHDNPERLSAARPLAHTSGITIIGFPTTKPVEVTVRNGQHLSIAALPYPSESRLNECLTEGQEEDALQLAYDDRVKKLFSDLAEAGNEEAVHIAMSHIYVAGSRESDSERPIQVGGAYTVSANSLPEQAQYVALGHLHRPQTITKGSALARYSGSPLAYSFSEANQAKSVTIIDVEPKGLAHISEIPLQSGKPLVRWIAKEGIEQVYTWLEEEKDLDAWIDLEVHLNDTLSIEEIHWLRSQHKGFIHIRPVFKKKEEQREVSYANLPIEELFKRFYEKQTDGAEPDDELVQLFLDLSQEDEE